MLNFKNIKNSKILLFLMISLVTLSCVEEPIDNEIVNTPEIVTLENQELSADQSLFFTIPTSFRKTVDFKTTYNIDNSFDTNDSAKLQTAINELSNDGGGRLLISAGNYTFNEVALKKNVHIEVHKNAIFKPHNAPGTKSLLMFLFTSTNKNVPLKNTSIYCTQGRFTVDLREVRPLGRGFRFCNFRNAEDFLVSNVNVKDNHTKFSAFVFNGETINDRAYGPKNGVVMNATTLNSDYGYGLVQMQLGKNILFRNISGIGGATLRLESHNKNLRPLNSVNVLDNVVARNVRCNNGNAAIMLSPHFVTNGTVDFRNISGVNCGAVIRIEKGFLTADERAYGLTNIGTFNSNSIIRNVKVFYAETGAQVKPKHYRYLPCNLRNLTTTNVLSPYPHGDSFEGPSIAGVIYDSNYTINFNESHVTKFEGPNNGIKKVAKVAIRNCN